MVILVIGGSLVPFIPFPEYRPDVNDYRGEHTQVLAGVVPRGDGWGPFSNLQDYTDALASHNRGFFYARKVDGTIVVFAATATRIYKLDNTSLAWTDVSKGGSAYASVPSTAQWQFAQFGAFVIAVQANTVPQSFDVETPSSAFADLGGSPPTAAYVTVVGRFLVLSGLVSNPRRIHWSGLDAITTWTAGTNFANYVDFPDGGVTRGVAGGEFGTVLQETTVRRMVYVPGATLAFQFERVAEGVGLLGPYSIVRAGQRVFFLSDTGFLEAGPSGPLQHRGKERVDRTVLADLDLTALQLLIGSNDPSSTRAVWAYKSIRSSDTTLWDTIIAYDYGLDRWSPPIAVSGCYIAALVKPGLTLESLDSPAPGSQVVSGAADNGSGLIRLTVGSTSGWTTGDIKAVQLVGGVPNATGNWTVTVVDGTHIDLQGSTWAGLYTSGGIVGGSMDAITFSFDSVQIAFAAKLAAFSSTHALGFFDGANLEAVLETPEQGLDDRRKIYVRGIAPRTDAATVYASVRHRGASAGALTATSETLVNSLGSCPQHITARLTRARVRIPAATSWSYAMGVEPDFTQMGKR